MNELDRVRYVTRYYSALQGLKALPFGLSMILLATRDLGWTWLGQEGDCTYTGPLFLVLFVIYFLIDRYYKRTFGEVRPMNRPGASLSNITLALLLVGVLVLENLLWLPVSILGLFLAALLIYSGARTHRAYYIPFGLLIALSSILPWVLGVPLTDRIFGSIGFVMKVTIGLSVILVGLIDHFQLQRFLSPVSGGEYARPE